MTLLLVLLCVLGLIAMLFLVVLPRIRQRLIFKPERGPHDYEEPTFPPGSHHEHLTFDTKDGERLHGWLVKRQGNKKVLLICHGNRGSIAGREDTVMFYLDMGLDVCVFDYRGYGQSTGRPDEQGTYRDVDAAWAHLTEKQGYDSNDIVILGRSLGAAIAAHLATQVTPFAIILESTFSTLSDIAGELHPWLQNFLTREIVYNTKAKVSNFSAPLLLVHSTEDELIGIHHGRVLQANAPQGTKLIEITGRHRDGFVSSKSIYVPAIKNFLNSVESD